MPYANTPSFNGSHVHGYDAMLHSILEYLTEGKWVEGRCTGKLNLLPGFDCNTGNYREYKRILKEFGIPYTILGDISDVFDSPLDGTAPLYSCPGLRAERRISHSPLAYRHGKLYFAACRY